MNLAPNGKPSNLTSEQYKLVRTPAFKEWFGDWENSPETASKVVDFNGEPLPVFHGTTKKFNVFDREYAYYQNWYGLGFYFTDRIEDIKSNYTSKGYDLKQKIKVLSKIKNIDKNKIKKDLIEGDYLISVFLDIKKPINIFNKIGKDNSKKIFDIEPILKKKFGYDVYGFLNYIQTRIGGYEVPLKSFSKYTYWEFENILRNLLIEKENQNITGEVIRAIYEILGFDGIIMNPYHIFNNLEKGTMNIDEKTNHYISFYPTQIKIADGTNTTFDSNNPDIRYAEGGKIKIMNLAPNGKPSNLTPEQYRLVRTPSFKEWFGDWENSPETASKVVDENGEPKVKWRGDNNPKNVFDYINYGGYGVYYFGDKGFAEMYGDKLNTYFIDCRNPFLPNKTTEKQEKEIRNLLEKDANEILTERIENGGFENLYDFLDNYYLIEAGFNENSKPLDILLYQLKNGINYFILELRPIIEWLKKNNYNGYESYEGNYDNIAVFNSTQIKLADGTNTTFDSNNPDIRYKNGGLTMKKPKSKLLAPNGKPSNLTPEQYRIVRTPAFKEWFGDWENDAENSSKVVDFNGEPLVVYHGTNSDMFYEFNSKLTLYITYRNNRNHFVDSIEVAKSYGKNVIAVFLKIKKPKIFDYQGAEYTGKAWGKVTGDYGTYFNPKFIKDVNKSILFSNKGELIKRAIELGHNEDDIWIEYDTQFQDDINDIAETIENSSYYDGIIAKNILDVGMKSVAVVNPIANQYIIFNSKNKYRRNQIKLADGTNTTFDSKNPDIRFAGGGKIKNIFSLNNPEYKDAFLDRGDEDKETWKDYGKKSIKFIIDEIKELKFPLTIYRGVKEKYSENPSEFVENRSWTTDIYVAKRFSGGLGSVVSKIIGSDDIDYESTIKKRILYSSQDEYEIILNEKGEKIKPKVIQESKFYNGGELTLTSEQVENKLGRKLHWWNDDVVTINGTEYKKVFLKPEYKIK